MTSRASSSSADAAARLDAYVTKVLAAAPPLTELQRQRLAELFRPSRSSTNGSRQEPVFHSI
ncbi:hypothetical protein FJK96_18375 [Mycobacteroides chelonae]|uniref:Uncharacterized protein n=1 Tax=Mycobacteroides chelonae TaxID=1774 RepID=A0AB73U4F5_MYCCH|nr:hypothetical protein FJK96_18375 [Mycobacteroides chelonae]